MKYSACQNSLFRACGCVLQTIDSVRVVKECLADLVFKTPIHLAVTTSKTCTVNVKSAVSTSHLFPSLESVIQ